jgi:hypothetical protein
MRLILPAKGRAWAQRSSTKNWHTYESNDTGRHPQQVIRSRIIKMCHAIHLLEVLLLNFGPILTSIRSTNGYLYGATPLSVVAMA